MPEDLDPSNKPKGTGYPLQPWFTKRLKLGQSERQVHFIDPPGIWRPATLAFSSTSDVVLEVTCSSHNQIIAADSEDPVLWIPYTVSSQLMSILSPITAVRIQNDNAAELTVDIL